MTRLEGKRALITGAASGIGREIAQRFVAEGARIALIDLDAERVNAAARELGPRVVAGIDTDVADACAVDRATAVALERLGGLDTLVNNAGIPMVGAVHELSEADWDRALAVDLKSVYLVSRAVWPHLQASAAEHHTASITSTASVAGVWATADQAAYAAAKAGVIMLTKCMALDGARDRIRVNAVAPGFVETPMLQSYLAAQQDPAAARAEVTAIHPLGRLGDPRDIAAAFVYLASDEAGWVTGTTVPVDGGLTAGIATR
ncbi:MAG TPA: glucose 1-dehydrogenase [Solirubrobacteraceae bacterium]|nr:glucose 1-dehydrogenase [Solirubrobacteraceae bacterium]